MTDSNQEPKLIIDEDWKTRVQREKEELEKQKQTASSQTAGPAEETSASEKTSASEGAARGDAQQLPPASLMMLVASLGTQAMVALGLMPQAGQQAEPADPVMAKHFIDLIAVIEEKTKGNLTADENQYVQETLYSLRMAFVEVKKRDKS